MMTEVGSAEAEAFRLTDGAGLTRKPVTCSLHKEVRV
jgi:hypothetical protein